MPSMLPPASTIDLRNATDGLKTKLSTVSSTPNSRAVLESQDIECSPNLHARCSASVDIEHELNTPPPPNPPSIEPLLKA